MHGNCNYWVWSFLLSKRKMQDGLFKQRKISGKFPESITNLKIWWKNKSETRKNIRDLINLNFCLLVVALISIGNQKNVDPYVFRESFTTIYVFLFCRKRRHVSYVMKLVIIINLNKNLNDWFLSNACLKNHANLVYFNSRHAL